PAILNPKSKGSVSLVMNDPMFQPNVVFGVFNDGGSGVVGSDLYLQISYFKIMAQVAAQSGNVMIFPPPDHFPVPLGPAPNDDLLAADAIDIRFLTVQSHIVGTTRMGRNIIEGVVDGKLNVFGLKN